jgi:hypothetical protein
MDCLISFSGINDAEVLEDKGKVTAAIAKEYTWNWIVHEEGMV